MEVFLLSSMYQYLIFSLRSKKSIICPVLLFSRLFAASAAKLKVPHLQTSAPFQPSSRLKRFSPLQNTMFPKRWGLLEGPWHVSHQYRLVLPCMLQQCGHSGDGLHLRCSNEQISEQEKFRAGDQQVSSKRQISFTHLPSLGVACSNSSHHSFLGI